MGNKNFIFVVLFFLFLTGFIFSEDKPEILIQQGHSDWITNVFFSSDKENIISVSRDKTVKVWNFLTGKLIQSMKGHKNNITRASMTSDGNFIVTGGAHSEVSSSELFSWNIKSGNLLKKYNIPIYYINDIQFSKNNKYFYVAGDGNSQTPEIIKYDIDKIDYIKRFSGMKYIPYSLSISPDEKRMISSGWDWMNKKFELILWNTHTDGIITSIDGSSFSVSV